MIRGEASVIVLFQRHIIQELNRGCINPPTQTPPLILCKSWPSVLKTILYFVKVSIQRSISGDFLLRRLRFATLPYSIAKLKRAPIFIAPTAIHYRTGSTSYQELLQYISRELTDSRQLIIGSDGAPAITNTVQAVLPDTTHLYCTRYVRKNIERQLTKCRAIQEERRALLEIIFDSSDSFLQSETEEELDVRLEELHAPWNVIKDNDGPRFRGATDFFQWFNRYQADVFRYHMIASLRIAIDYVHHNGSPRLFHNNDIEAINYALKSQTNWELQPLLDIIDMLDKQITQQRNESVRVLHDSGEHELVPSYAR